jgi:hypothetical protein
MKVTIDSSKSSVMTPAGVIDLRDVRSSGGTFHVRSYPFIAWNGGDAEWTIVRHIVTISLTKNR